ncbi:MobF family relaxase [Nocardioides korecus]
MTVHKLTAGDGYTYLTRQVASADEQRPRGQSLADYYVARGNPPGVWLGAGSALLGLEGTPVYEAQMKSLFGQGLHPNAERLLASGATSSQVRLGRPFAGQDEFTSVPGRASRTVSGFDLVFTPVKSVSILWGLSSPETRSQVEDAHHAAVASAMNWVQTHAAFTRTGHAGVAQIDATGLICAAFDHRESRAGDPDLHTHVAVANKVCGSDGRWRSLDARGLFGLGVAASEHYNTRLEDELARRLGVEFQERSGRSRNKRPVREVVGIPQQLITHFSRRRAAIETRLAELMSSFRLTHGREPKRSASLALAQQATLETRQGKPPVRALAEQVSDWRFQADSVLGRPVEDVVASALHRADPVTHISDDEVDAVAHDVVRTISVTRATWTLWNVYAETERALRSNHFEDEHSRTRATEAVVGRATGPGLAIRISEPELIAEPDGLRRASDGRSTFIPHGSDRFTTSAVLAAEDALVAAGTSLDGPTCDDVIVQAALALSEARSGQMLDLGQRHLVEAFASPARLVVGIGAAGTGKTTAMQALRDVWSANGGRLVPLATSARAAEVLGDQLDVRAENLHKFLFELDRPGGPAEPWFELQPGDLVLVDEAGMAGTMQLARLLRATTEAGATLRLLGDPAQLASVDAGGALRLLEHEVGAIYLTELHRFENPDEARASLLLREGSVSALTFYEDQGRIRSGSDTEVLELAYAGWASDDAAGLSSVLIAATNDDVVALNARARLDRVASGAVELDGVILHDGNLAGVGDRVTTRENDRFLGYGRGRWVRNGDTWRVVRRHHDGSLTLRHIERAGRIRLPADYVAESVELAYAGTVHRVQGATTNTAHALVTSTMTGEALYVASTRARTRTTWYVETHSDADVLSEHEPETPPTAADVLTSVLGHRSTDGSATEALRDVQGAAEALPVLVRRYEHARHHAAADSLTEAAQSLDPGIRSRLLADPARGRLADALATASGHGHDAEAIFRAAVATVDLDQARSPALVLAERILDHGWTRRSDSQPGPLPWLPAPDVGHAGWSPYLEERASLIRHRLAELGSLIGAYREQYDVTDPDGLGAPPPPGTRQADAYQAALREQAAAETGPPVRAAHDIGRPRSPSNRSVTTPRQGPRLSL